MKLEPGKKYINGRGEVTTIIGLAACGKVNGQTIYWALNGNHYAENGQLVTLKSVPPKRDSKTPYPYERRLIEASSARTLKGEAP